MQDWLIFDPTDLSEIKWDFTYDVLKEADRCRLALNF